MYFVDNDTNFEMTKCKYIRRSAGKRAGFVTDLFRKNGAQKAETDISNIMSNSLVNFS